MRRVISLLAIGLTGVVTLGALPTVAAASMSTSASSATNATSAVTAAKATMAEGAVEPADSPTVGENPPGRVSQPEGTGGYVFGDSDDESLSTTVTLPSMNCSNMNVPPGSSWSPDMDKSFAVPYLENGPAQIELYYECLTQTSGEYLITSTLDPDCEISHGFGISCPEEAAQGGAIVPGDRVELQLTTSTTSSSASVTDLTSGGNLSWTGSALTTSSPEGGFGVTDDCTVPGGGPNPGTIPCSEVSPSAPAPPADYFPYGSFQFDSTTINGSDLGTALAGSTLTFWSQDNSVYGSTLLDQTSYVGSGDSFSVTYADTTLPAVQVSSPAPVDQPTSNTDTVTIDFDVTLTAAVLSEPVYVDYSTEDGTALSGTDYQGVSGTLEFTPGETGLTVPVTVLPAVERGNEVMFTLALSNPSYAVGGPSGTGTIVEGPVVLSVSPNAVPLSGMTKVTVTGLHFGSAGDPDAVTFCDVAGYQVSGCAAGTDIHVDSDTELTVVTPNGTPLQPFGYAQFDVDTFVTDAAGVSSQVNEPDDELKYGCEQLTAGDGEYTFAGCVTPEGSTDVSEQGSSLDGMDVSGASPSAPVDYQVGGSSVSSAGTVGVSLNLGGKLIPILKAVFAKQLSAPITFTVPKDTQIAGMAVSGTLTLTPDGSQAASGSVKVTLPGVLGGGTGSLSFVTTLGQGLSSVSIEVPKANFMDLFALTDVSASYDIAKSTWSLAATASTGPSQSTSFSGSLTYSGNTLASGSLVVKKISLAGLLEISSLTVKYSSKDKAWDGSASIVQTTASGKESATVSLTVGTDGTLTKGELKVGNVPLYGVLDLESFDMTYASGKWGLEVTAKVPDGGSGEGSASLSVANGIISSASLSLKDVSILGKVTINTASLSYTTSGGDETWTGSWDLELPQAAASAINNINGSLTFVNGSFTKGQIGIGANIPLVEGVFLTKLDAALSLSTSTSPMVIGGDATISFGPKVKGKTLASLTGGITRTFANSTTTGKYVYTGNLSILGTVIANGEVDVPDSGDTTMALTAGATSAGLVIPLAVGSFGIGNVTVVGGLTGTFNASKFSMNGKVTITIPGISTPFTANLVANSTGMAACAGPSGSQYGFEYDWGGTPRYEDNTGCSEAGF